jgi:hypothetical protein
MLDTQYRMHPDISWFPNKAFYDSQLKDGTAGGNGVVKCGLEPPKSAFTRNAEYDLGLAFVFDAICPCLFESPVMEKSHGAVRTRFCISCEGAFWRF